MVVWNGFSFLYHITFDEKEKYRPNAPGKDDRSMAQQSAYGALVLAAGRGTRMKSSLPKVMLPLLEEPMLYYVLLALEGAGLSDTAAVIGHGGEIVRDWLARNAPSVTPVWQREQLGTGHAVMCASDWIRAKEKVLVVNGDMPMLTADDIARFLELGADADAAFMTCDLDDPAMYGRVIRSDAGVSVVEAKDASASQLRIKEINAGVYLFDTRMLLDGLSHIRRGNSQNEYYIVDLISWGCSRGYSVKPVKFPAGNLEGANGPAELARLSRKMRDRVLARWLENGVRCVDAESVWISPRAVFEGEAELYPDVQIWGESRIGAGCRILSGCVLRDTVLGRGVECLGYVVADRVTAEDGVKMGPFCYLRDGTHLEKEAFAGKFVEIKNSRVCERAKVPHLSYIGDAHIGEDTNIGAATVTCNYDGVRKNPTRIGARCFVGSDTMFVAPVVVGDGATVGAGSVITKDVPSEALAVARGRQVIIRNWAGKKTAERE